MFHNAVSIIVFKMDVRGYNQTFIMQYIKMIIIC